MKAVILEKQLFKPVLNKEHFNLRKLRKRKIRSIFFNGIGVFWKRPKLLIQLKPGEFREVGENSNINWTMPW